MKILLRFFRELEIYAGIFTHIRNILFY